MKRNFFINLMLKDEIEKKSNNNKKKDPVNPD